MTSAAIDCVKAGLVALGVVGCTQLSAVPQPADFLMAKRPTRVWVTGPDSTEVVVTHPKVRGDTLSGYAHDRYFEIPLVDVKLIRASVPARTRTLLLAGAGAVAVGVVVVQQTGSKGSGICSGTPPNQMGDAETPSPC